MRSIFIFNWGVTPSSIEAHLHYQLRRISIFNWSVSTPIHQWTWCVPQCRVSVTHPPVNLVCPAVSRIRYPSASKLGVSRRITYPLPIRQQTWCVQPYRVSITHPSAKLVCPAVSRIRYPSVSKAGVSRRIQSRAANPKQSAIRSCDLIRIFLYTSHCVVVEFVDALVGRKKETTSFQSDAFSSWNWSENSIHFNFHIHYLSQMKTWKNQFSYCRWTKCSLWHNINACKTIYIHIHIQSQYI